MKVLSFDVGIVNLAYCLLDIDEKNESFNILRWDIINLADNRKYCEHNTCKKIAKTYFCLTDNKIFRCKQHSTKINLDTKQINLKWKKNDNEIKCDYCKNIDTLKLDKFSNNTCEKHKNKLLTEVNKKCANKKCKDFITTELYCDNIYINGWCKEHYLTDYDNFIKSKTKKISQNSNKTSVDCIGLSIFEKLDKNNLLDVDIVFIENQPSLINPIMKSVSSMIFSYFLIKGIHEKEQTKSTIKSVKFCSPSNKIKVGGQEAINEVENASDKKTYKVTKELGKKICKLLIEDDKKWLDFFMSNKKKDDLADSFLQGIIMSFNKIPDKYKEKIKSLF